ncbi:hypothetical protein F0562_016823 [Nyssa sinensis]|uniref:HSF-type DNA-binding domain-containing protein n=1 Tax=Nyssa sinensis TaxID=561372 RepID=A0A5J4ZH51_9ASTE|nr:hypothetical protein F0562_016823 [Nyssa sinensis]
MNPNDESSSKSPPSSSPSPPITSSAQLESSFSMIQPDTSSMASQPFPFSMGFAGSSSSSSPFTFPFVEFPIERAENTVFSTTSGGVEAEENLDVPQPLEFLQGNPIPPFLSKTFDLVDDPTLDPIISWSSTGQSFVVWDPVEFREGRPSSKFQAQQFLEFCSATKYICFLQGKRHLLKNIQRRKSPQSQQIGSYGGSSTETGKAGVEGEIEWLRKEKSLMMQEVIELQQQQRGTVQHMEAVNEKLQAAEQRQKQMVSFLAKLLQNPVFLARLQQKEEQRSIASPRMRKFVKNQQHETGKSDLSMEGRIVKHRPHLGNLTTSSVTPDLNPNAVKQFPDNLLLGNLDLGAESMPLQIENITSNELAVGHELIQPPEQAGEGVSSLGTADSLFKGIESIIKQEDLWSMGFDAGAGMSSSSNELWANLSNYDLSEFRVTGGFSDIWDLGSLQAVGGSEIEKWPGDESPFDELESQAGQPTDDSSKKMDP